MRSLVAACVALALCAPLLAVEDIPDVNTLEDLQKSAPVKLGDWEVRLGLGDGGEGAQSWKLIYCLAKYVGPEAGERIAFKTVDRPEFGIWALGPVHFSITTEGRVVTLDVTNNEKEVVAQKCFQLVRVYEEVVGGERVTPQFPFRREWVKFAELRPKVKKGEPELVVSPSPVRWWWPKMEGQRPILEGEALKAPGVALPGKLAPGGIDLKIENGAFVLRSAVGIEWDENHLLARWWVNGKPPPQVDRPTVLHALSRRLEGPPPKEARVALALPEFLGVLKKGDKVAVQVLFSPDDVQRVPCRDGDSVRMGRARELRAVKGPLLSNKIEFAVTEEMLKARETP